MAKLDLLHSYTQFVGHVFRNIGLFDALQLPLMLIAVALAFAAPGLGAKTAERFEARAKAIAARPLAAYVLIAALAIGARAALIPWIGTAQPLAPDETSLMLQAQTLLHLRLANPARLSPDFATQFVLLKPAYASMYPVLRSLPLAVGGLIGGAYWLGVWLSMIGLALSTYWALSQYVERRYALIAAVLVVLRLGLFSYWVNSYWGGAFTALGGLLLISGFARLRRADEDGASFRGGGLALGAGVFILMTTRPFEGLVFCLPIGVALALDCLKATPARRGRLLRSGLLALAFVAVGAGLTAAHDRAVTGDWRRAPFSLYRADTLQTPAFLFQAPIANPPARYYAIDYMNGFESLSYAKRTSLAALADEETSRALRYFHFLVGFGLLIPFLVGLWDFQAERVLSLASGCLGWGLAVESWDWPHYAAPAMGVVLLIVVLGLKRLRAWAPIGRPVGLALSRFLPLSVAVGLTIPLGFVLSGSHRFDVNRQDNAISGDCCWVRPVSLHSQFEAELARSPGRNLVVVDSGRSWPPFTPVVYNEADPEAAATVWLNQDPAYNPASLRRLAGRRVWRLGWGAAGRPCLSLQPGPRALKGEAELRRLQIAVGATDCVTEPASGPISPRGR